MRYVTTGLALLQCSPAAAQDYNYVPGWANTYNHSRIGSSGESSQLEPCRFDMLPRDEQQRLHDIATARVRDVGEDAAMPWIDKQSRETIAEMVEAGLCGAE